MLREFRTVSKSVATLGAALAACGAAFGDDGPAFSVPLEQQPSGAFYVRGTVAASVETDLLVDTGSSYVVLSRRTFERIGDSGAATFKRTIQGATASGRIVRAKVFELSELALGPDCVLHAVEVVVLPGSDRDILGLSALERVQPFTFDISSFALRFSACGEHSMPEPAIAASNVSPGLRPMHAGGGAPW